MSERELFDTYNKDVYRTCYLMLRNVQDAEDLCHDVFVTVFRQDWRQVEQLRAWIMRIAMNQCLNLLRKRQTHREKQPQLQWLHQQKEASVQSADAHVLRQEASAEWEKLLSRLPEKLMAVVTLRFIGELSTAEISEVLHIPQGTVKSRLHKALKCMKKELEGSNLGWLKGEKRYGTS
ncbi:RNA polymerase sigma factor [Paenibacillus lemnae]|uniref:RNA polymerase sigma factor n=1 Tax=Paenibacillus lemnae TaxID=1330551 RepID=A0A848MAI6_PAELE|nr:RNA polymerase sigma factor [Paenibacillus lemnae]NMO97576.1 RNA polymerase sigma factor [Paenibacillus lemnae]